MTLISSSDELEELSVERIWGETEKALKTSNPEEYFVTLQKVGAMKKIVDFKSPNLGVLIKASSITDDIAILWCVLVAGNSNFEEINKAFGVPKELSEISIIAEKILIFNEGLTLERFFGAIMVIGGILVTQWDDLKSKKNKLP